MKTIYQEINFETNVAKRNMMAQITKYIQIEAASMVCKDDIDSLSTPIVICC